MSDALIHVASWEDRFLAGYSASADQGNLELSICLASERYKDRTEKNRRTLEGMATVGGVKSSVIFCDFGDVVKLYDALESCVKLVSRPSISRIIFDISTAPRHVIWGLLDALSAQYRSITLRYVQACEYGEWQTDEDQDPRLVVNCSGVMLPDLPTCLVMMCGPEVTRAERMIYRFEPRRIVVLRDVHAKEYGAIEKFQYTKNMNLEEIEFDNKDLSSANQNRLSELISPLIAKYNVVGASFGPKLGAIALYMLVRSYPEVALAYVPAGTHNIEVSSGIASISDIQIDL